MLIHAYRRKSFKEISLGGKTVRQSHTVELGDLVYRFLANEAGESVCEVKDESHQRALLKVFDAYKPHGGGVEVPAGPERFIVTDPDGNKIDLAAMDDANLRELVERIPLNVDKRKRGDTLRQAIVDAIKALDEE